MPGGRPMKFTDVVELQALIDAYFKGREEMNKPFTITGLALALDTTRETLMDYEKKGEFSDTIKKAKARCENYVEEYLFEGKNQTGAIFALKNYGWKDKSEYDHTSAGKPIPIIPLYVPGDNGTTQDTETTEEN